MNLNSIKHFSTEQINENVLHCTYISTEDENIIPSSDSSRSITTSIKMKDQICFIYVIKGVLDENIFTEFFL